LVVFGLGLGCAPEAGAQEFAYVTNSVSDSVSAFVIDPTTGALAPVPGSPFPSGSQPLAAAADPSGRFLYVSNGASNDVWAYSINATSGVLTPLAGSPFSCGSICHFVTVDPTGRFAYVANAGSNNISGFVINSVTGALTPVPGSPFPADTSPHSVAVDPTGQFVYAGNMFSSDVSAYTLDSTTGGLTQVPGSPFAMGAEAGFSVSVDPTGRFVYLPTRPPASSLWGFTLDPGTGALAAISGSPYTSGLGADWAAVHPSGQYVYVGNSNSGNVSAFVVDNVSGALTTVPGSPFAADPGVQPRGLAINKTGRFVYVMSEEASNISGFSVDNTTGALALVSGSPFLSGGTDTTTMTTASPQALNFPIKSDKTHCKGGKCTPMTVNISAVFDHRQTAPYGKDQTVEDYRGELGQCDLSNPNQQLRSPVQSSAGYAQSSRAHFTVNGNYTGGGSPSKTLICGSSTAGPSTASDLFLFYDGHPGYDYPFNFHTAVYPALSGCVSYQIAAAGGVNQTNYHVLAIVPSSTPPPGGCQGVTSETGYVVFYLHLASYVGSDGKTLMVCPSPPKSGSVACPNAIVCKTCPPEGTWVGVSAPQPIAYVGNFANGKWGAVGPHLHFEVDQMPTLTATPIPLDPYGWWPTTPGLPDPYLASHKGVMNTWLWQ
jgi:6-phosphogluconolactonase (cycloisomerase 2 family)/murein DD-endopeptidase MepM/ murein hydrolase activator NlpD